ncbi:hypothetical protein E2P81_ATG09831 [Venturia nashicola]|uniref:Inhibitor I9 domain-containing protein n=1 Tax=Venturia nashicola TaxID=86259 RepID=A0A4Z1NKH5_9PEZI|nr:hypothetical protein E6O75_ATG10051 [Venturia nashicola]TLD15351.1 hypothetical protein E2P81_ATG09831 [Venturia nashicola]
MKFSLPSLLLLTCFSSAAIAGVIPSYILYYLPEVTAETKAQAKDAIVSGGGQILYEYQSFNAMAATIPNEVMDTVKSLGEPQVVEDHVYQLDDPIGKSGI